MHLRVPRLQKRRLLPIQTIPRRSSRLIKRISRPPPCPRARKAPTSALHHDLRRAVLLATLLLLLLFPVPLALATIAPTMRPLARRARARRHRLHAAHHRAPIRLLGGEPRRLAVHLLRGPAVGSSSRRLVLGSPAADAQQRAKRRQLAAALRRARRRRVAKQCRLRRLVALRHGFAHPHAHAQQAGLHARREGGRGGGRAGRGRGVGAGVAAREEAVDCGLELALAGVHCEDGFSVVGAEVGVLGGGVELVVGEKWEWLGRAMDRKGNWLERDAFARLSVFAQHPRYVNI